MLTLDSLLSQLAVRPDAATLMAGFVPPTRFVAKSFADYHPRHPTQAAALARLRGVAADLPAPDRPRRLFGLVPRALRSPGRGLYLDGGFGVGKTHLLAALWNAVPGTKAYLAFDELMYFVGLYGPSAADHFRDRRFVAVDEWELDDPGNLKMALAFLRAVLARGAFVAVTSNTLPLELGAGRFSQKDFRAEIEELAGAFEVVRVEGEDYRHRHYVARPGTELYWTEAELARAAAVAGGRTVFGGFGELLGALEAVHPIRYREIAGALDGLYVRGVETIADLPAALRWVHFVDSVYDAAIPFGATGSVPLGDLFPATALAGPFGKKLSRCLSRMEEMVGMGSAPARA